ncbi:ATP-dependent nuclease [Clostridium beijerinckii]|uniref:ATP-dependent nuclease n=1 Tax=Clostridium beijerinckii TaxID=1520 RepID=UPI00232D4911|nr:ATP-dependent endonuclease [Clostridium beijerinckii]
MFINKIKVKNFRLLNETILNFKNGLNLLIGRNNTGKTSFLVAFDKFYNQCKFDYNDFSVILRDEIDNINENTDFNKIVIQMILEIEYNDKDNLENLSDFILDLDPKVNKVKILFECSIRASKILESLANITEENKKHYIKKNIGNFMQHKIYAYLDDSDLDENNRYRLVEKDSKSIKSLINFQIIQAKREVCSSEESSNKRVLSSITTKYYNNNEINSINKFDNINNLMSQMDNRLNPQYEKFFDDFLKNAKEFLNLKDLKVISNLQSKELLENYSEVVYGAEDNNLPENFNGLGHMNILYLLLTIETRKKIFIASKRDINLLFIEEPEAHTHPQLQYIFARRIKLILNDIPNIQTIITTHSPYIVSQCDFRDIKYLMKVEDCKHNFNIIIKDFYEELSAIYEEEQEFNFLKQYLSIQSAELFFASKIIFIEGISERILLPYFISKFDEEKSKINPDYVPIASQSISVVEAGANAKAFKNFIDFLQIKTLIITDIDTVKEEIKVKKTGELRTCYIACAVSDAKCCSTSNATLKYFLDAPTFKTQEYIEWIKSLKLNTLKSISSNVKISYQKEEKNYHARSFEDAFINVNLEELRNLKDKIGGIKCEDNLDSDSNIYELTKSIIDKKSDFASSLLYLALTNETINWNIPLYMKEGLEWIVD